MKKLIHQLEQYLRETIGITVVAHPWAESSGLPQYLRERYRFFRMDVLGTECVLMADIGEEEQTPAVIGKHLDQVRSRGQFDAVYVRHAVTSYNRKRLIEQKVPFIVPGNQMYLPILGIDLREHLKRLREKKPVFSPSTQALILHILWRKETGAVTPAEIAHRLGYSPMTMTRAFDELETTGIGEHSVLGKERHLCFVETGKPLWEKVLPYLNTPVRKRLYVASSMQTGKGSLAGQSALARYTMLAEPKIPVIAFSADEWKVRLQQDKILKLTLPEPGGFEIELWKYAPAQFAKEGRVDCLSLYLSLKDNTDERVQSALDALLGGMGW
jgi:DNA-binding MarR family transcriptional regulator